MKKVLLLFAIFIYLNIFLYLIFSAFDVKKVATNWTSHFSEEPNPIEELMEGMTLEEKVGQLFLVGFWGKEVSGNIKTLIDDYHIGGVILLHYNLGNDNEIIKLNNDLQAEALASGSQSLFISIDQEGGIVSRLKNINIVSQAEITTIEKARAVGQERGEELSVLGINVNYSPVLDFVNQSNSFLYDRVFHGGIELVNDLGKNIVEAYQSAGIIPVIKHYPGHPDDKIDSHKALPTSSMTKEEILYKAQTFKAALNNNPMMLMSGHISYPQVDVDYPTSLSKIFLEDILRADWGYNGVIITDDLEMGALQNNFINAEIAKLAFLAGNDILLYSSTWAKQIEAYESILFAVESGEISEERLNQSVYRILDLKNKILE